MTNGFAELNDKFNTFIKVLKEETPKASKELAEELYSKWQSEELNEIVETKGQSVDAPFDRQEKAYINNWKQKRKYNVPFDWVSGVYTGATYWALWKGISTKNIKVVKQITETGFQYGFESGEYINFNVGISQKFEASANELAKLKYESLIKKALS